ncbi:MAG: hypothetical protein U9R21_02690 [Candidatus Thermoplasmatota archaeon]|nr:hypothetical protein [Candidatus Thermoplasmatota archaeon]
MYSYILRSFSVLCILTVFFLFWPAQVKAAEVRPHDIGGIIVSFKSYLEAVIKGTHGYSPGEIRNAKSLYRKISNKSKQCTRRSNMADCLWGVAYIAYQSDWSTKWERDEGYYKRDWLLKPRADKPWFGNPRVPGLACATYSRGVGSMGAYIDVTADNAACSYWEGTYYWNVTLRRYCKYPGNCNRDYIDTIPPPPPQ